MTLTRADLWSLEEYAGKRNDFRARMISHKKDRHLRFGDHLDLIFEDRLTIQYQIQEMLRIEKIFEADGIQDELDTYNPLIPDGDNWKCTLMIQYDDPDVRREKLRELVGIEDRIWLQVGDNAQVFPIADEDLVRDNEEKTSAVHFLRYQLDPRMVEDASAGAPITAGVDHPACHHQGFTVDDRIRVALVSDLGKAAPPE